MESSKHGHARHIPGGEVDNGDAGPLRRRKRLPGDVHPARQTLENVVIARLIGAWTCHPEARQRTANNGRIEMFEIFVTDSQFCWYVTSKVRIDHVGVADQVLKY